MLVYMEEMRDYVDFESGKWFSCLYLGALLWYIF